MSAQVEIGDDSFEWVDLTVDETLAFDSNEASRLELYWLYLRAHSWSFFRNPQEMCLALAQAEVDGDYRVASETNEDLLDRLVQSAMKEHEFYDGWLARSDGVTAPPKPTEWYNSTAYTSGEVKVSPGYHQIFKDVAEQVGILPWQAIKLLGRSHMTSRGVPRERGDMGLITGERHSKYRVVGMLATADVASQLEEHPDIALDLPSIELESQYRFPPYSDEMDPINRMIIVGMATEVWQKAGLDIEDPFF